MEAIVHFLVTTIGNWGYIGIFILMFLESSFFPFPSEVVMIPAGYLAYKGDMNLFLVIISGVLGSLSGAWFNYLLASKFGRKFLEKFISKEKLNKLDYFFEKHGHISTFSGRLIPGVRQYISFPAGLANMNGIIFSFFTALGSLIWILVLVGLGYFIGQNQELIHKYLREITAITLVILAVIIFIYYKYQKAKNENSFG
ncbi:MULTISPECIES: DedA family protein [unclassified Lebetimonas]|uniref:DedA family protein n=1 Tax=unclassified Lebetimonas TaxID=2648158 RepID=UPI0004674D00|nr:MULTISPECIES: DedA family protein [unclassified Lebetimonas]